MKKIILLTSLLFSFVLNFKGQRTCGQEEYHTYMIQTDPNYLNNQQEIEDFTNEFLRTYNGNSRAVVTIPVVFHVVYNTTTQNISDSKINAQINQLNLDFSKLNTDNGNTPSIFQPTGNMDIQFCLATIDPNGNPTTGIERRQTTITSFSTNNSVKYYAQGGLDAWPSSSYLNIWVCYLSGGILGYAQFPGGSAATDGVVLTYNSVGSMLNPAGGAYGLGRTATHEVGHWLNLRHIWGDANCGTDNVTDTPTHNAANYGCPTYPHYSTCTGTPVEMTMNFMDYTDDACMYMFSNGQAIRSQALFASGGARASLLSSNGCGAPLICGNVTNLSSSNITQTSCNITWTSVGGAIGYTLQYKPSSSTTWTIISVSTNNYTLTNLNPSTAYNVQVKANCSNNSGSFSSISFATLSNSVTCTDDYEPNNQSSKTKVIPVNTPITGIISSSTDKDWFSFTNTSTNPNIRVDLTNLPADYTLRLYNNSGAQVGSSQNSGTISESIVYNTTIVGTWKIQVFSPNGAFNSTSCYNLLVSLSPTNFRLNNENYTQSEEEFNNFNIYPNPFSDVLNLNFSTNKEESYEILLVDNIGRNIFYKKYVTSQGLNQVEIDLTHISSGLYNLVLIADDKRLNFKIVKN